MPCLTCPDFQTTAEFLPVHYQQAQLTRELLDAADAAGRPGTLPSAERATTDSLRQQLSTYRDEISRLRTENQELRDQLARHLGAARAAAATTGTQLSSLCRRTSRCPLWRSRRRVTAGRNAMRRA